MSVEFTTTPDGVAVLDPAANRRMTLRLDGPPEPSPAQDPFPHPVDDTIQITTSAIRVPEYALTDVHDESGRAIRSVEADEEAVLGREAAAVSINGPIKLFATVAGGCTVSAGLQAVTIAYEERTPIVLGARSLQSRPTSTIHTTPDPESMMTAVSALSSALKTTSSERSWPTLRDHPPLIERGDSLEIPTGCEPPETGITIRVPSRREAIYAVAPLAYYIGATVVAGSRPSIETTATDVPLEEPLDATAAQLLKHLLLLDCIVRTAGLYPDPLEERLALEDSLPGRPESLYDEPIARRLDAYLDVPVAATEPHVPQWPTTAYLSGEPGDVEALPFILHELGTVRIQQTVSTQRASRPPGAEGEPVRSSDVESGTGSMRPSSLESREESLDHAWFGPDAPIGATLASTDAYRNGLMVEPRAGDIAILIVCNEVEMLSEHDQLADAYATHGGAIDVDVTTAFGVSTDELATLLTERQVDLVHFIGHSTAEGLRCHDGHLDIDSLPAVTPTAFFLNACHSREQGRALIEGGAVGGVCTMADVVNEHAVRVGEAVANLLSAGFPLSLALNVANRVLEDAGEYLAVGNGSLALIQPVGGVPSLLTIDRFDGEREICLEFYPTPTRSIGSTISDVIRPSAPGKLLPATFHRSNIGDEELREYLLWTDHPVVHEGTFHWTEPLSIVELSR